MLNNEVSTVPLDLELCPIWKEKPMNDDNLMEVDEPSGDETPMEVDLDEHDHYLIHRLETNFESDTEQ